MFRKKPLGVLGLLLVLVFGLMATLHPLLMATIWDRTTYHPLVGFDYDNVPHPTMPSSSHLLGTDSMGRDILSQLLFATQTSFGLGLVAGIMATSLATIVGVLCAHFGGLVETILMGISDAFVLMPPPVVLLVVGLLLELGWLELALIYGIFAGLGSLAIIAKADAQSIKIKPYIEAARLAGGNGWYIIRTHYLPNMLSLVLVNMMFTVTQSVLIEALLSFFGRTHLRMSWGTMIWFTQVTFRLSPYGTQWHALLPPVLSIMLFCGAFYMVGRSLDEVVNPRVRQR
jgi:peptide/nickel transport system permease protein